MIIMRIEWVETLCFITLSIVLSLTLTRHFIITTVYYGMALKLGTQFQFRHKNSGSSRFQQNTVGLFLQYSVENVTDLGPIIICDPKATSVLYHEWAGWTIHRRANRYIFIRGVEQYWRPSACWWKTCSIQPNQHRMCTFGIGNFENLIKWYFVWFRYVILSKRMMQIKLYISR